MGVDWLEEAESDLKEVLGNAPSFDKHMLVFEGSVFEIWHAEGLGDGSFDNESFACLASGETLTKCIENYRKNHP